MADSKARDRHGLILSLLCAAELMLVLDFSIVTVALPDIEQALSFSQQTLQWVISAYALTFGGLLLLGGRAADLFGRRRMLMIGLTLFTLASLAGGFSQSQTMLIAARATQGTGAAVVSPAALSILLTTFPEGAARNRALTVWGAMAAGGIAIGVLLGGIIATTLSWRWVLFVNVPVGAIALIAAPMLLKKSQDRAVDSHIDWSGGLTVTAGLFALVYALEQAGSAGLQSVRLPIALGLSAVCLIAFALIERRSPDPIVPLSILQRRTIIGGSLLGGLMNAALGASVIILTLYMQKVLKYSPLQAGLSFAPAAVVALLTAPFAPKLVARFGAKYTLVGSITAVAVGLLALSRVPTKGHFIPDLLPGGIAIGLGIVVTQVAVSITATSGISDDEQGLVSGLLTTFQQIGSGLGVGALIAVSAIRTKAVGGMAAAQASADALTAGYRAAVLTGAGFAIAGIVVSLLVLKKERSPRHAK